MAGRNNQQIQQSDSAGPGRACVSAISLFLLLLLLTGAVLLILYIFLPTTTDHAWFLPAGMCFVAAPWVFWMLTCFYRCIALRIVHSIGQDGLPPPPTPQQVARQPTRQATLVATAAPLEPMIEEQQTESPDSAACKVRFANGDEEKGGTGGGSSNTSRESEQPLAHSMN